MMSEAQVKEMARLVFFNIDKNPADGWDKITKEAQDSYYARIRALEENLSRLNLEILPAGYVKPDDRNPIDRVKVEYFIKAFIERTVKKPSGIVNIFPYKELALEICREYKINE